VAHRPYVVGLSGHRGARGRRATWLLPGRPALRSRGTVVAAEVIRTGDAIMPLTGARMVIEMDRAPSQPVKDPPSLARTSSFSMERLLSHIDPGTAEESEEFVRLIYEERHIDLSFGGNGKAGR
jgi:hypothetical protein